MIEEHIKIAYWNILKTVKKEEGEGKGVKNDNLDGGKFGHMHIYIMYMHICKYHNETLCIIFMLIKILM
jgi:hypothetical protein